MLPITSDTRRFCPSSALFCAALAIAAALYSRQVVENWALSAESDVLAVCLLSPDSRVDRSELEADLKRNALVRDVRFLQPAEVESWVSKTLQEAGTSASLSSATQLPGVVEVVCEGGVRQPKRFAAALEAIRNNSAFGRVFVDERTQQQRAEFYGSARKMIRAFLVVAIFGAVLAGWGSAQRRKRQAATAVPMIENTATVMSVDRKQNERGDALDVFRAAAPVVGGWLCVFLVLLIWGTSPIQEFRASSHVVLLVETIILVEVPFWCAAGIGRILL